jgi:hypothetical protein
MLDFGKAFNEWMSSTHLANEGARLAAVNYCPRPNSDPVTGVLTCDWTAKTGCTFSDSNRCLAQWIDSQTMSELKNGRTGSPYAPAQNAAKVCIYYPNGGTTQVGDPVTVDVQVTYHWLNYVATRVSLGNTVIRGSATMRLESPPYSGTTPSTTPTCYPGTPAGS